MQLFYGTPRALYFMDEPIEGWFYNVILQELNVFIVWYVGKTLRNDLLSSIEFILFSLICRNFI